MVRETLSVRNGDPAGNGAGQLHDQPSGAVQAHANDVSDWQAQQAALRVKIHAERLLQGLLPFAANGGPPAEADLLNLAFTSHRRVAGPLVVAVKRLLHRLMTPILAKQSEFNRTLFGRMHAQALTVSRVVDDCAALHVSAEEAVDGRAATEQTTNDIRSSLAGVHDTAAALRENLAQANGLIAKQQTDIDALRSTLDELRDSVRKSSATAISMESLETVRRELEDLRSASAATSAESLESVRREVEELRSASAAVQEGRTQEIAAIRRHVNDLTSAFESTRDRLDVFGPESRAEQLDTIRPYLHDFVAAFEAATRRVDGLAGAVERSHDRLDGFERRTARIEEDSDRAMRYVRRTRAASRGDARADDVLPGAASPATESAAIGDFDYAGFEARFRGAPDAIAERQRDYLRYFRGGGEVLDVGCGRGEFVSLLLADGIPARGIDVDLDAVLYCEERGLPVARADAFEHLAALPDGSLGGVFLAQVIEHLPTSRAIELVERVYEKLRIGGVFVIETLNPESYAVLARWFLLDPTHVRLVHPETLRFVLESKGFRVGPCEYRQPVPESEQIPALSLSGASPEELTEFNAAMARVNKMLNGPLDYYLVARRA